MISYNDVLAELQDYILDENNIQKSLKMKIMRSENEKHLKINKNINIRKSEIFIPNQQDSLFWCYYIIKNGDILYETLNHKNSLVSKQMKIDLVSIIRKNKDIVKTYKFDTISNIESNLANENNLNKKTFLALCSIENINIIYVSKKTYFELRMNDTNIVYIIHEFQNQSNYYNKTGFEMATEEKSNTIRETLYKLVTIDKSIKAISSYTVKDLIEICNKLEIEPINKETGKHKSKKELYELIIQYF
jgi:hypothetical protein